MLKNHQTSSTHRHSFLRFILIFATLIIVFYATTFTPTFNNSFFPAYLKFQAKISSSALNMLGENTHVTGTYISSAKFAVNMVWGCDALEPSALFIAAVLAFPAPVLLKIAGILIGTFCLLFLNLVRIVSLFLIGVYYPDVFDVLHLDIWQILFILLTLVFFLIWLQWITPRRTLEVKNVSP
jgi:exosortase H (IPTLxxWG-CTERM-specific)